MEGGREGRKKDESSKLYSRQLFILIIKQWRARASSMRINPWKRKIRKGRWILWEWEKFEGGFKMKYRFSCRSTYYSALFEKRGEGDSFISPFLSIFFLIKYHQKETWKGRNKRFHFFSPLSSHFTSIPRGGGAEVEKGRRRRRRRILSQSPHISSKTTILIYIDIRVELKWSNLYQVLWPPCRVIFSGQKTREWDTRHKYVGGYNSWIHLVGVNQKKWKTNWLWWRIQWRQWKECGKFIGSSSVSFNIPFRIIPSSVQSISSSVGLSVQFYTCCITTTSYTWLQASYININEFQ